MNKFVVLTLLMLLAVPTFATSVNYTNLGPTYRSFQSKLNKTNPNVISTRQERLNSRHCPECNHHNPYLSQNDLYALEKYALNKTYRRENDLKRLERLENLAFGATQVGDVYSRYRNVENAILSRPKYGTKNNSILKNLANYFSGQTTGFTPNLIQYPSYNSIGGFNSNPYSINPNNGYSNNNFEQYSNGIFGGGWGFSGNNYGTGSSIRILD